jgi:hypothetical protein
MFFTFARVGAVVAMTIEDDYDQGRRSWLRFHEKGGKQHEMPANHHLQDYIDAYIQAAGIAGDPKGPLFRSAPRTKGELTRNPLRPAAVWRMIRRRTELAGIKTKYRLPELPGHRNHQLPGARRHAGDGPANGRASQSAHHQALRPDQRPDHARRSRENGVLTPINLYVLVL